MKPTFVLGVGAQKAGTSWLWETLANQSFSNMGFKKEYHIWDANYVEYNSNNFIANVSKPDQPEEAIRRLMQLNPNFYVEYFKGLIQGETTLTGDITPAYAFLKRSDLKKIKNLIEAGGFDLKVVFLLRDPVERIWSAQRMSQRNSNRTNNPISYEQLLKQYVKSLSRPEHLARGDYIYTIKNLESVFHPDQINYELYEDLFNEKAMVRLEKFLGKKFTSPPNFDKKVNNSKYTKLPPPLINMGANVFKDQYNFCFKKFPQTKHLWKNNFN